MVLFALSQVLPGLTGYLLLRSLWPGPRLSGARLLLSSLAVGCGLGISSCGLFAWLVLVGPPGEGFKLAETAVYLSSACALLGLTRQHSQGRPSQLPQSASRLEPFLTTAFLLAVALKIAEFAISSFSYPHGIGDAWFTWNMRARFLYRGGDHWTDAFSNLIGEGVGDYPLLLPLSICRGWLYLGRESQFVPATIALLFTFATVGTLFSGLAFLRSRSQGALAGLLLLGTTFFLQLGWVQVADVPLSFFYLAVLTLLAVHDAHAAGPWQLLLAAGLMLGFAAWTKNEGLLFVGSVVLARLLFRTRPASEALAARLRPWRDRVWEIALLFLGALTVVGVLGYFKTWLAPPSYLIEGQGWQTTLDRLGTYSRYRLVLVAFLLRILQLGGSGIRFELGSGLVLLLPVYRALVGPVSPGTGPTPSTPIWLVVFFTLLGYAIVYLVTPLDLLGHLNSSLSRLLLHLWPLVLLGFFLTVATPEEALARQRSPAA